MANMINGQISNESIAKLGDKGQFQRPDSAFRGQIIHRNAVPHRFHLYVSYACPWAHRTLIVRNIKNLKDIISVSVADPFMGEKGWTFSSDIDPKYLAVIYVATKKDYTGKISVPVLWDKEAKSILNNESSEIIRILNTSFDHLTQSDIDLYPDQLKDEIDRVNAMIYEHINNGVYKTGFAGNQKAYEEAYDELFDALDVVESILSERSYLAGDFFTEADIRLFTTLLRFDAVYYGHFKCNKKRIVDYHNLHNYLKSIYQIPEVKSTCHFDHIKEHYYKSHTWINPTQIVPKGPELDLESSHDRQEIRYFRKTH
jgi:glutathionyl-hydroquinone reductase